MLYVGNGDGIGLGWMGWLSEVIGILRAPSVLIKENKYTRNRRKIDRQRSYPFLLDMLQCFLMPHGNFSLLNPEACDSLLRLILQNLKTPLRRRRGTLDPEDSVRLGRTRSPTLLTPRDLDSASGIKRRPPRQSNPATDQPHIPRHSRPPSQLVQQHFCCSVLCGNAKIVFLLEKFLVGK